MAEGLGKRISERLTSRLQENPKWQTPYHVARVVISEITGGVGPWGALKPLIAVGLSLIPFLFLGQHFNGEHSKAFDWTALQIPLLFCLLWPLLFLWSIFDAYQTAMLTVAEDYSA